MKKVLLLSCLKFYFVFHVFAQSISPSVPGNQLACPGTQVQYSFTPPSNYFTCSVTWSLTGSYALAAGYTLNSNPIRVIWSDQASNVVRIQVTGRYAHYQGGTCSAPESATTSMNQVLRSVVGQSLTGVVTPRTIPFCEVSPTVIITIDAMKIRNTGQIGQPAQAFVDRYEWILSTGWKQASTNATGTVYTSAPTISVQPANQSGNCTPSGTVKIRGIAGGTGSCLNNSVSNQSTVVLNRTPIFTLTAPAGYAGQKCGMRQPVLFTATAISCATSYNWTYPAGWSGPASTPTNSVSVTPGDSGGNVTVVANTGTCNISASYTVSYSNVVPYPGVSNTGATYEWCNYETFSFTAVNPAGYLANFGYDWYGTGGILFNGVAATSASPLHTTSNSVTVTIPGSAYGPQSIGVRMNNQSCAPSAWNGYSKRVGPYNNSEFFIVGPNAVCANQVADFTPNFITSDVTGYQWNAPSGWSASGHATPYFHVSIPSPFYGGAILLRLQNRCGWTNTPYVMNLSNTCGFNFTFSPNPTSDELTVSELDSDKGATIQVVDKNQHVLKKIVAKQKSVVIDIKDIPNGIYFLSVTQGGKTEVEQIVISH